MASEKIKAKNLKVGDKIKFASYTKYQQINSISISSFGLPLKYRGVTIFLKGRKNPYSFLSESKISKFNK